MAQSHTNLIEEPQWVSRCVEDGCRFEDDWSRSRYVCRAHRSGHSCASPNCLLVRSMANRVPYESSSDGVCPVVALLAFRREELEFRDPRALGGQGSEPGYGALRANTLRSPPRAEEQLDTVARVLKSCLPAGVALFSTLLSKEFFAEYDVAHARGDRGAAPPPRPWTSHILDLANRICAGDPVRIDLVHWARPKWSCLIREAVLKTAVATHTLFQSQDLAAKRFAKRLVAKDGCKHGKKAELYTCAIMLALCFFPYLKHESALSETYDSHTLVLMCFDKTRTRHNQWSALATHAHLHSKSPVFEKCFAEKDLSAHLPLVVTAMLEQCVTRVEALAPRGYAGPCGAATAERPSFSHDLEYPGDAECRIKPKSGKKRKTPCVAGFYEASEDRLGSKAVCRHLCAQSSTARGSSPCADAENAD